MHTGKELGTALKEAMKRKKVTQQAVAREFGVSQPSVSEWIQTGRIAKEHINHLIEWFSDVADPEHWGLNVGVQRPAAEQPPSAVDLEALASDHLIALHMRALTELAGRIKQAQRVTLGTSLGAAIAGLPQAELKKRLDEIIHGYRTAPPCKEVVTEAPDLWRDLAVKMAKQHEDPNVRSVLINFVNAVDGELASRRTGSKLPS